jgi:hypothetical protein
MNRFIGSSPVVTTNNYNTAITVAITQHKVSALQHFNYWMLLERIRSLFVSVLKDAFLTNPIESESELCYDRRQSSSLSLNKAPIWGLRPDFYYCQTVAGLLMSGALSDERTGLSCTTYNVQYVYILHVILRYSFTNLI